MRVGQDSEAQLSLTAQRKNRQIAPPGEQHDQQYSKQKARHRIANNDDTTGPDIKPAAIAYRFPDSKWDRDEISYQCRPQPDRDRHRQFVLDQVDDPAIAKKAVAKIEGQIVPHHQQKTIERRLVKAILFFELLDQRRAEPAGTA